MKWLDLIVLLLELFRNLTGEEQAVMIADAGKMEEFVRDHVEKMRANSVHTAAWSDVDWEEVIKHVTALILLFLRPSDPPATTA